MFKINLYDLIYTSDIINKLLWEFNTTGYSHLKATLPQQCLEVSLNIYLDHQTPKDLRLKICLLHFFIKVIIIFLGKYLLNNICFYSKLY